jgi:hypothetical protein
VRGKVLSGVIRLNLGVIHAGAPCCGMNAAVRSFVRNCIITGEKKARPFYEIAEKINIMQTKLFIT